MSPDGNKIAFASKQPLDGGKEQTEKPHIWIVERTDTGWGELKCLDSLTQFGGATFPCFALNGNLYFYSGNETGVGGDDIWMSRYVNGKYTKPENLGNSINTGYHEVDPFIAPDESYLVFCRRDDGFGGFDLYISFREKDNSWTKARNLGDKINSSVHDFIPSITPDGKYFFFVSERKTHKPFSEKPITFKEKINILTSPGNGSSDIYWVSTKIIEEFQGVE